MVALFGSMLTCLYQLHVHTLQHSDYSPRTDVYRYWFHVYNFALLVRARVVVNDLTCTFFVGWGMGGVMGILDAMQHYAAHENIYPQRSCCQLWKIRSFECDIWDCVCQSQWSSLGNSPALAKVAKLAWIEKKEGGRSHVANGDATLFIPLAKHFFWDLLGGWGMLTYLVLAHMLNATQLMWGGVGDVHLHTWLMLRHMEVPWTWGPGRYIHTCIVTYVLSGVPSPCIPVVAS